MPNPEEPGTFINIDTLTSYPYPLQSLVDEGFRAVKITAGDSICAAISDEGELRVWGSFRVSFTYALFRLHNINSRYISRTKVLSAFQADPGTSSCLHQSSNFQIGLRK